MRLPEKKFLFLIIILSLVAPIHYAINFSWPPAGTQFVGYYPDDAYMLDIMKSVSSAFDFTDPFVGGENIWHNPLLGSTYLFVFFGLAGSVLGLNLFIFFVLLKFLFGVAYFLVVYNLISVFVKTKGQQNMAFVLFALAAGAGGILYLAAQVIFPQSEYLPIIGYAFTREFDELAAVSHSLTHIFRLYYGIPETLGYLALLFFAQKKKLLAGLSLGLVFLIYPMHGVAFSVILLFYFLAMNYSRLFLIVRKGTKDLLPVYLLAAVFLVPWLVHSNENPYYFTATRNAFEALPLLNILVSFFFPLALVLYFIWKKPEGLFKSRMFVVVFALVLFAFSIKGLKFTAETSPLFTKWLSINGLLGAASFLADYSLFIDFAALAFALTLIVSLMSSKAGFEIKFMLMWLVAVAVMAGINPETVGRTVNTVRFAPSLIFPVAVLASYGLISFSTNFKFRKIRFKPQTVLLIIVLLSLPSLLGYNLWLQKSIRGPATASFLTEDEYKALIDLRQQPQGTVFSSIRYGPYIPYYSDKYGVIFSGRSNNPGLLADVNNDVGMFYNSSVSVDKRKEILDKYNATYVFVGPQEKGITLPETLKKLRSGETEIYAVP